MQDKFSPHTLYHLYNEGNNGQKIFFTHDNYLFFLWKMRRHLLPHADFVAYCLMPNHFHWLLITKPSACEISNARKPTRKKLDDLGAPDHYQQNLSHAIAVLLRSYSRAINKQEERSGSLFRQKTKVKNSWIQDSEFTDDPFVFDTDNEYPFSCFYYIHEKPVQEGLVEKAEDWIYSSALDYARLRRGTLCNQQMAKAWIGLSTLHS